MLPSQMHVGVMMDERRCGMHSNPIYEVVSYVQADCAQAGEIWLYPPFLCACCGPAVGFGSHVLRLVCDDHPTLMQDGELHLEVFLVS